MVTSVELQAGHFISQVVVVVAVVMVVMVVVVMVVVVPLHLSVPCALPLCGCRRPCHQAHHLPPPRH